MISCIYRHNLTHDCEHQSGTFLQLYRATPPMLTAVLYSAILALQCIEFSQSAPWLSSSHRLWRLRSNLPSQSLLLNPQSTPYYIKNYTLKQTLDRDKMQTVVIMHGIGYMRIPIIFRILIALHHTLPSRTSYHEIKKPLSDDFLAEYCLETNN